MPQKYETRAVEARASRNSCGGRFRVSLRSCTLQSQAIPPLVALHIGESYLAPLAEGRLRHDSRY